MKWIFNVILAASTALSFPSRAADSSGEMKMPDEAKWPDDIRPDGTSASRDVNPFLMGLGILGGMGSYRYNQKGLTITALASGGLLSSAGVQVGDLILGADGKEFDAPTIELLDGGKGPQEGLGYGIQNCLKSKTPLALSVKRGSQTLNLKIPLPALRPFSKNYPENCPRTDLMLEHFCAYLRDSAGPDVVWGHRYVTSSSCGLCLLANGDRKDATLLKALAKRFCQELEQAKESSWSICYMGTYLCEYYLATGDTSVLPGIKWISEDLVKRINENGRSGHGYEVGYNGDGMNIITAHILLDWALIGKCGVAYDTQAFERGYKHCLASQFSEGCIGYGIGSNPFDSYSRTAAFVVAMSISGKDKAKGQAAAGYLYAHLKQARETHTNGVMSMLFAPAALALNDKNGYREFMDYWSWYFELCNRPDKDKCPVWYIGGKRNNVGDSFCQKEFYFIGNVGSTLAIGKHNLFIHGNTKRGWFLGKRAGGLIAAYRTSCKNSADMLDAVAGKVEDLSAPEELKDALTFSRDAVRISEKGKKFRAELLSLVKLRAGKLVALSALRPAFAQNRLKILMDLSVSDPELGPELKVLYKAAGGDLARPSSFMALYDQATKLVEGDEKSSASSKITRFKTFMIQVEALAKSPNLNTESRLELQALSEWAQSKISSLAAS